MCQLKYTQFSCSHTRICSTTFCPSFRNLFELIMHEHPDTPISALHAHFGDTCLEGVKTYVPDEKTCDACIIAAMNTLTNGHRGSSDAVESDSEDGEKDERRERVVEVEEEEKEEEEAVLSDPIEAWEGHLDETAIEPDKTEDRYTDGHNSANGEENDDDADLFDEYLGWLIQEHNVGARE